LDEVCFSTGTFSHDFSLSARIEFLIEQGIRSVELSGGNHEKEWRTVLSRFPEVIFSFHNYFPPPEVPFVFNLASSNSEIRDASINLCKEGILLSSEFGQRHFSFHAGFLFDPTPSSLGSELESSSLMLSPESANSNFYKSIDEIAGFAARYQVAPLVENNVLTLGTASNWGSNSLLLATANEIEEFSRFWGPNVGVLVDVGHLNVSSRTLELDFDLELERCMTLASALHLHSNTGKEDEHLGISGKEPWWKKINPRRDIPWTFEVKPNEVSITLESLGLK
jgi:sugar phosphate isomerase/epimerase